jgi:hypothetical protein
MVARVGVETYLYAAIAHLLYDVACVFDTWVLFATADKEYVKLFVKSFGVGHHARDFFF